MQLDEYRRMAETETVHWWYGATRSLLRQVLAPHLVEGSSLLDLGCGTGATGGWLEDFGDTVSLDFEALALEIYREKSPGGSFVRADAQALPFRAASFDAVLCVTVLCHESIADPVDVVRECARVLRPGGVACLMEPGVRSLRRAHDRQTHTARRFAVADLAGAAAASGLDVVRETGAYSFLVPPATVKALTERKRTRSDLETSSTGLGGILPRVARLERRWLERHDLPAGLSAVVLAAKPR
ncbi:MAG: class I SAM-dependent methyltransferase [Acidimicrobiia bacterium]|nr:class I SAM-dependent methyltransferase [Acidimicrobiia bacterium]